ncbi:S8 family serine peptidase [Hyphomicrobium sp.]|uniref:S8 family peptidase n=1 Tax=Hyphomicrobium sp. TaxID=82 RepID=UPI0025BE140F|nr:S8 family serine peptidase [Hyphomicrobium sp.]MCC7250509.1 S8 family serine peptidase [Hyphomicrobium sp.]
MTEPKSPLDLGSLPDFNADKPDELPTIGFESDPENPFAEDSESILTRFWKSIKGSWTTKQAPMASAFSPALLHIRALEAASQFNVRGEDAIVAVIDSGCWADHPNLRGRVLPGVAFLGGQSSTDTSDSYGHGTSVAGLIAGNANLGVAPKAKILPIKVIRDNRDTTNLMDRIAAALEWLVGQPNLVAVNISLGNDENYSSLASLPAELTSSHHRISTAITALRQARIPIVAAAGNAYAMHASSVGMCYPAVIPEIVSVGAVHSSASVTNTTYSFGNAKTFQSHLDAMAPFSQRLPQTSNQAFTRLIAPGAPVLVTHADGRFTSESGTSLAAPLVAGVIALMQQLNIRTRGTRAECREIENWIMQGAKKVVDAPGGHVNVNNTGATFCRLDAFGALNQVAQASTP